MGDRYKHTGIYAVGLLIAILTWSIGLSSVQRMQAYSHLAELRYDEKKLTIDQIEMIIKNEKQEDEVLIKSLVAWEQKSGEEVENETIGRKKQVELLKLYGETNTLLPLKKLAGDNLLTDDTKGCIISKKAAYDLWGGLDVIGKPLKHGENEYVIRGVLDDETPLVILQAPRDNKETVFTGLRLSFQENDNIREEVRKFQGRYGLDEGVMIDLSHQAAIWAQLILLPGLITGLIIIFKLFMIAYMNKGDWKLFIGWLIGAIVTAIILVRLTQFKINLPIWLIPNQWSDFEFWTRTWTDIRENKTAISALPKFAPDLWGSSAVELIKRVMLISGVSFVIAGRNLEVKNENSLFWHILLSLIITFIGVLAAYYLGFGVIMIKALWLIWPAYLVLNILTYYAKNKT